MLSKVHTTFTCTLLTYVIYGWPSGQHCCPLSTIKIDMSLNINATVWNSWGSRATNDSTKLCTTYLRLPTPNAAMNFEMQGKCQKWTQSWISQQCKIGTKEGRKGYAVQCIYIPTYDKRMKNEAGITATKVIYVGKLNHE